MKYDVVIIGSGFGGLVCAHLLSQTGRSVLVLERQVVSRATAATITPSILDYII